MSDQGRAARSMGGSPACGSKFAFRHEGFKASHKSPVIIDHEFAHRIHDENDQQPDEQ